MATYDQPFDGIRGLSPADSQAFRQHLGRLDPESLHNRFAMAVSTDFLDEYATRCFALGELVYAYAEQDVLRASAEMRRLAEPEGHDAELVFSVEADWRNRGIGRALFEKMIIAARARGFERLHMNCLAWNRPMQALARRFEAEIHFEPGDIVGTVIADTGLFGEGHMAAERDDFTTAVIGLPPSRPRWGRFGGLLRRRENSATWKA
jgi:GNAT superfamily N-acetyltransferase